MGRYFLLMLPLILLTAGCAVPVKTEMGAVVLPAPVLEKLPVTVGVLYTNEFKTAKHIQKVSMLDMTANLDLSIGPANISLFDQLTTSMFSDVVHIDPKNPEELSKQDVDAILEPSLVSIHYGAVINGIQWSFSLSLTYNVKLYLPDGDEILTFSIQSNPPPVLKVRTIFSFNDQARELFDSATREIAAQFYAEFSTLPEISNWLNTLEKEGGTRGGLSQ